MLKRPLRSPVSVLKNLKAGTSKIHRNSLLPLRTFENCLKKKGRGRNLNSETKCKSQIWWFSVTMGNFKGVGWGGWGGQSWFLVGFYVSLIFIFHILQRFFILLFTIPCMSEVHSVRLSRNNCMISVESL